MRVLVVAVVSVVVLTWALEHHVLTRMRPGAAATFLDRPFSTWLAIPFASAADMCCCRGQVLGSLNDKFDNADGATTAQVTALQSAAHAVFTDELNRAMEVADLSQKVGADGRSRRGQQVHRAMEVADLSQKVGADGCSRCAM